MLTAYLTLISGLLISVVAIYYSVAGLMAIYPASIVPIICMGVVIEFGKLAITVWLKQNWSRPTGLLKYYAVPAIVVLMLITSTGVFGFLSKAHSDQTLVSGDVQSKIAIYDEKIKTAKENIESDRKQLKQMDDAVDQVMARSQDEKGADKSNAIRKSQQRDRISLAKDIETNQKIISQLNDEAAPIRAEVRKVEAEVGPIKYIASFLFGSNPDANLLERAVNWVTVLIVIVLDPLAIVLLLASQYSFEWAKKKEEEPVAEPVQTKTEFEGVRDADTGEWVQTGPSFEYQVPLEEYEIEEPVMDWPEPIHMTNTSNPIDFPKEEVIKFYPKAKPSKTFEEESDDVKEFFAKGKAVAKTLDTTPPAPINYSFLEDVQDEEVIPVEITHTPHGIIIEDSAGTQEITMDERPGDYISDATYIQNEEQAESNVWTKIANKTITEEEYLEEAKKRKDVK